MQIIGDFRDWKALKAEMQLPLAGVRTRPVTLDVNAPQAVGLYCVGEDGEFNFIARVVGREKVRFVAEGKMSLIIEPIEGDTLYIYTRDGDVIHLSESVKERWSKYHERKAFNPEVEAYRHLAMQNQNAMERMLSRMQEMQSVINSRSAETSPPAEGGRQAAADSEGDAGARQDETDQGTGQPAG